jgi:hypothetical protein
MIIVRQCQLVKKRALSASEQGTERQNGTFSDAKWKILAAEVTQT